MKREREDEKREREGKKRERGGGGGGGRRERGKPENSISKHFQSNHFTVSVSSATDLRQVNDACSTGAQTS